MIGSDARRLFAVAQALLLAVLLLAPTELRAAEPSHGLSVTTAGDGAGVVTLSPPAASSGQWLSAGDGHGCAIRSTASIACFGDNTFGQSTPPAGSFAAVTAGAGYSCAIRTTATLACWGINDIGQTDAPTGTFTAISDASHHTCAIRTDASLACWGLNDQGQLNAPTGSFNAVSAGGFHTCAVRTDASLTCWGHNVQGQTNAPAGSFTTVSAGEFHSCALRTDASIVCWGENSDGQSIDPIGSFATVSAGGFHTCALRTDASLTCWGLDSSGQSTDRIGKFTAVSAGFRQNCAIRADASLTCWGANLQGQSNAPAGSFGANRVEYPEGTNVSLTPTAEEGSIFAGWSGDVGTCVANEPICVVTMDQERSVTAAFATLSGPAGTITDLVGDATIIRVDGTRIEANTGTSVFQGDVIETSAAGAVNILFADNTTFAVSESARLSIDQYVYDAETESGFSFFRLLQGWFVYTSGLIGKTDAGNVNIETPVGVVGIRGTQFAVRHDPNTEVSQLDLGIGSIAITPLLSGVTTEYDALQTIVFDTSNILSTTPLTQASYDLLKGEVLAPFDGINEAPTCAADQDTTAEDVALSGTIESCADVDFDPLTYAEGSTPATDGTVVINLDGTFTFTPTADFHGDATFSVKATDGTVDSTDATFTVHVTAVADEATFDGLIDAAEELDLPEGTEQSLIRKVANAQEDFLEGDIAAALDKLESLLSQLDALEGKKITTEGAATLRTLTELLVAHLAEG